MIGVEVRRSEVKMSIESREHAGCKVNQEFKYCLIPFISANV